MMWTYRPWYHFTATYPKDIVIMIDKSWAMSIQFGGRTRMHFGIKAAKTVIASLNQNDNVRNAGPSTVRSL